MVDLLDDERLIAQIVGLERRTARGGRDSIDHAPGAHDDLANAVAGVVATLATANSYDFARLGQRAGCRCTGCLASVAPMGSHSKVWVIQFMDAKLSVSLPRMAG